MTRFGFMGILSIIMISLLLSSCAEWFPHTYRFRMTVEVDTPEGVKTGSSVYEVGATNYTQILADQNARGSWVKGEAVTVELTNGQTLFVLLKTPARRGDLFGLSMETLYPKYGVETYDFVDVAGKIEDRDDDVLEYAVVSPKRLSGTDGVVQDNYGKDYPMMVVFGDISNPTTVKEIDPQNLPGGGRVKRIIIELTDDPITTEIEKKLGWLDSHTGPLIKGTKDSNWNNTPRVNRVGIDYFQRGIK